MDTALRRRSGRGGRNTRLRDEQVLEIFLENEISQTVVAKKYGVTQSQISRIQSGQQ